jgi:hypothetical protein
LAAHYAPIVRAVGRSDSREEGGRLLFDISAVDMSISMPALIFDALYRGRNDRLNIWPEPELAEIGTAIAEFIIPAWTAQVIDLPKSFSTPTGTSIPESFSVPTGTSTDYTGPDLIGVHLGESWLERDRR